MLTSKNYEMFLLSIAVLQSTAGKVFLHFFLIPERSRLSLRIILRSRLEDMIAI